MVRTGDDGLSPGRRRMAIKLVAALLAGLVVVAALLPWYGVDSDPPVCWSMFDYVVPCGSGLALAAGAATTGVVAVTLWLLGRRS
jgi:hypothetical protein